MSDTNNEVRSQVGFTGPPEILTPAEAAAWLRLADNGRSEAGAVAAMDRLVDSGRLRPLRIGGKRLYSLRELRRFVDAEVQNYQPIRPKGS